MMMMMINNDNSSVNLDIDVLMNRHISALYDGKPKLNAQFYEININVIKTNNKIEQILISIRVYI